MTWKEATVMSTRLEFVLLAQRPNANIAALCRGYGISRKTAYKWIERYRLGGKEGLQDQSRKPHTSPATLGGEIAQRILELNELYPYWGARKLRALLPCEASLPHHSTISATLSRHGRQVLGVPAKAVPEAPSRFEHPAPNLLWQIDFKGHFPLTDSQAGSCHPLTILDDHSRFNLCLAACANEWRSTVQEMMTQTFCQYGLPERITTDNGPPWGMSGREGLTQLEVWWIRLGIRVSHSRPYHPQTQGKGERFHRTLKLELLERQGFNSLTACQAAFDGWRDQYNLLRPHEALDQRPPVSRYRASGRQFPATLPPIEYEPDDVLRKVNHKGEISYQSRRIFIGEGLQKQTVAVRPATVDGVFEVYFCHHQIRQIDLRDKE
jgi:transposase InsO family protein